MVLRSAAAGTLVGGPDRTAFREALVAHSTLDASAPPAVRLCGSGRGALRSLLDTLEVPRGSTVMLPAYTFAGVAAFLVGLGYRVALCDVDRARPVMTEETLDAAWHPGISCVLLTHLFGAVSRPAEVVALARDRGALVIEDCAHALGTLDGGRPAGLRGAGAFFSFDLLKPVNTFGGGAALLPGQSPPPLAGERASTPGAAVVGRVAQGVAEDRLFAGPWLAPLSGALAVPAVRAALDRADRRLRRGHPAAVGSLSNLQSRIGVAQLGDLERRLRRRREVARRVLASLDLCDPQLEETARTRSNAYFTVVKAAPGESPLALRWALWARGIDAGLGPDVADDLGGVYGPRRPVAADWFRRALQLPGGAALTERQVERLCRRLRSFRGKLLLEGDLG
jgi:perosamine synthetase